MNISGGMSVINIPAVYGTSKAAKVYLWPDYARGTVEKIKPLTRETPGNIFYTRASDEDMELIISAVKEQSASAYSSSGKYSEINPMVRPGLLFDATV